MKKEPMRKRALLGDRRLARRSLPIYSNLFKGASPRPMLNTKTKITKRTHLEFKSSLTINALRRFQFNSPKNEPICSYFGTWIPAPVVPDRARSWLGVRANRRDI
ncbi:MAG TPA: hypothetical protein VGI88_02215, partial [Verrucomicrobiae bacterium]